MSKAPVVYVDADACPVKAEILRVCDKAGVQVVLVANGGLRPSRDPLVKTVIVPQGADAADDWIVEHAVAGDIVVTADVPLAQRSVEVGAAVLGPTGRPFTPASIGMARAMRDLNQDLREAGTIAGYNASFTQKDRAAFTQAFADLLQRQKRAAG